MTFKSWLLDLPDNHRFAMLASHIGRFRTNKSDIKGIIKELEERGKMSNYLRVEIDRAFELFISGHFKLDNNSLSLGDK